MSLNYISTRTATRTSKAGSISSSNVRKNLVAVRKTSPKLKQSVILLFVSGGLYAAASASAQAPLLRLEKSGEAMGSTYTVDLYGTDRVQMEAAADAAFDEARRLDDMLSNYKPDSELSQVNGRAAQGPMKI